MPEPSLSEITNFAVDPERGAGTPAVVIDNSSTVRNLNENARFKAQNDMQRYNNFLGQLSDVYKEGFDIAKTEVMPQDRQYFKEKLADITGKIAKDPKALFSRQGMDQTYGDLIKLKADATKSKMDNVYGDTHETFFDINPSFKTKVNADKLDQYRNTPLEKRVPFQLDYQPHVDLQALTQGLGQKLSQGFTKVEDSPQGSFIVTGKKLPFDSYMQAWNGYLMNPEYRKAVTSQYGEGFLNSLPESEREQYKTKDGQIDIDKIWNKLGKESFISTQDPNNPERKMDYVSEDKRIANPFGLLKEKAITKQQEQKDKFNFELLLEGQKQRNRLSLESLRKHTQKELLNMRFSNEKEKDKVSSDYLKKYTDGVINKAYEKSDYLTDNGTVLGLKLPVDDPTLSLFSRTEKNSKGASVKVAPDDIILNQDGETFSTVYYKGRGTDKHVDPDKTATFTLDAFPARLGENLFGKGGNVKVLSQMGDYKNPQKETPQQKVGSNVSSVVNSIKGAIKKYIAPKKKTSPTAQGGKEKISW